MNKNYLPFLLPLVIFFAGLGFLGYAYYKNTVNRPGALQISSKYGEAEVMFRGKSIGKTPIEVKDLKPGKGEISIKGANFELKKDIIITEGALTVVSADTGVSEKFSANMTIWYDKTNASDAKIFITSTPTKAKVKINDKEKGETPLTLSQSDLTDLGETLEYSIALDKEGYEGQVINLKLEKGYTLNLSGNLYLNPLESKAQVTDNNNYSLYTFTASDIKEEPNGNWARAIAYYLSTRGAIQIENKSVDSFEYYVDSEGTLYNKSGAVVTNNIENKESNNEKKPLVAYLNSTKESNLSDKATETLKKLFGSVTPKTSYKVIETGVGFLNVRSTPDTSGELLGKLNIGDAVNVKEEQGEWYKIDFNGKEGYVYATYVEKIEETNDTETPKEVKEEENQ